jgi:hypothetical protein
LWQLTPPLTAHKSNALKDLPQAKNSGTDRFWCLLHSIVALLLRAIKGKSLRDGWFFAAGSESKNRWCYRPETSASAELSVARGK